jgi:hypothetical protein
MKSTGSAKDVLRLLAWMLSPQRIGEQLGLDRDEIARVKDKAMR